MKKYLAFAGVAAVAVFFPAVSLAASMNFGQNVAVEGTSVAQGNAYAAGAMVTVSGLVNGDLLTAGGTIISSAKVNGDIMAAGGTVTMVGVTAQDARVAGGNVTVGGALTGELVAAAGNLVIVPGTTIVKDSYLAGGSVNFSGSEAGNLNISGGDIYFNGTVNGNVTIARANKVTIGSHAVIKGALEYSALTPATIAGGANIAGTPVFHEIQNTAQANGWFGALSGIVTVGWFLKLLIVLVAAYLLWYCFRSDVLAVLERSRARYGTSLLHGFLLFIAAPVAIIIAFVTVIGAIPGLIALFAYLILLILAAPLAAIMTAMLLRQGKTDLRWYHILLGAVVIDLVGLIPFIGWIACALVYLAALGAVAGVAARKCFGE